MKNSWQGGQDCLLYFLFPRNVFRWNSFEKNEIASKLLDSEQKVFKLVEEFFQQGCRTYILRVQKNFLSSFFLSSENFSLSSVSDFWQQILTGSSKLCSKCPEDQFCKKERLSKCFKIYSPYRTLINCFPDFWRAFSCRVVKTVFWLLFCCSQEHFEEIKFWRIVQCFCHYSFLSKNFSDLWQSFSAILSKLFFYPAEQFEEKCKFLKKKNLSLFSDVHQNFYWLPAKMFSVSLWTVHSTCP